MRFLKECGTFYLATSENGRPSLRPFGAVTALNGQLFFTTGRDKAVYRQLKVNPAVQIAAQKPGTRDWISVDGEAVASEKISDKMKLFKELSVLYGRFTSPEDENFSTFYLEKIQINFMSLLR